MRAEQADAVYQRYRELVLNDAAHRFELPLCSCGMDHGRVIGDGELEPTPVLANPFAAAPKSFELTCQLCSGKMLDVTEDEVLFWMDVIGSLLMYADLLGRGVYARADES